MFRKAITMAIVSLLFYAILNYLKFMGFFKSFHKHYPGPCKRVKNARYGSEDMAWTSDGLAFITSGLPVPAYESYIKTSGSKPSEIQLYDFNTPSFGVVNLTIKASKGFDVYAMRPHGIDVLEDKVKSQHLLYVVNHPHQQSLEVVEKFQFDPTTRSLIHLKTIEMEEISFANDVSVVAEDQFYISNYLRFKSIFLLTFLQHLFPFSTGGIFFHNGTKTLQMVHGVVSPNGNCLSKDKRLLYVLASLEESLLVYVRDITTNSLELVQKVNLNIKVDNPTLTPPGDALLVAANPCLYKGILHLLHPFDPEVKSPSSVLRVPLGKDGLVQENDITEIFYDHGDMISGSSSAAVFDGQMLVGSVVNSLVHCQLKQDV